MKTDQHIARFAVTTATHMIVNPWGNTPVREIGRAYDDGFNRWNSTVVDAYGETFTVRTRDLVVIDR